jgi:hypothetical protein
MTHAEVLLKLEQQRLENFRQDVYIQSLLNSQRPSFRLRLARTLHSLALRLYPEVETRHVLQHRH